MDLTSTPFIAMLDRHQAGPLGNAWDRDKLPSEQSAKIPRTFVDAMTVRKAVNVDKLGVPLAHELQPDDRFAFHWVIYMSARQTISPEVRDFVTGELVNPRKSKTETIPLGTIRMVPFPHLAFPRPGGVYTKGVLTNPGAPASAVASPAFAGLAVAPWTQTDHARAVDPNIWPPAVERPTQYWDGREPYIKIGRLTVRRDHGDNNNPRAASQLIDTVVQFMRVNSLAFNQRGSDVGFHKIGPRKARLIPEWQGLFCAFACEDDIVLWQRHHFQLDRATGRWMEDGVPHVAMFRRIELPEDRFDNVTLNSLFLDAPRI
ncbi:hypothetical protein QBC47DRAFT_414365 [Echria macrotheca]|uniref:Uncharacterized protein n=1 Tax=Echria macrotheca TaxID=438768 RepID=A0AAJ0BEH6_9PEZI|nr:hypothetical protein QBC47DRAFT_414365 [Echria macrotheca]